MSVNIKHAILMVSYNHENYIKQALDSILLNDVLPDVLIIYDDCSVDSTWTIIKEYRERFPDIIKARQNEKNLGLYANINAVWCAGIATDCDVLSWCSGDDLLEKNLIENLNAEIIKQKIDIKNDKCIIVTNSVLLYPTGKKKIWNNYKLKNTDMRTARLGKKLNYREVGMSRKLFENFIPLRDDIGLASDTLWTFHNDYYCEKWYFADFVGAYYRVNVGAVSRSKVFDLLKSESVAYSILLESKEYDLTDIQRKIALLWVIFDDLVCNVTFKNWCRYLKYLVLNFHVIKFYITRYMLLCLLPPIFIRLMVYMRSLQKKLKRRK